MHKKEDRSRILVVVVKTQTTSLCKSPISTAIFTKLAPIQYLGFTSNSSFLQNSFNFTGQSF